MLIDLTMPGSKDATYAMTACALPFGSLLSSYSAIVEVADAYLCSGNVTERPIRAPASRLCLRGQLLHEAEVPAHRTAFTQLISTCDDPRQNATATYLSVFFLYIAECAHGCFCKHEFLQMAEDAGGRPAHR